jgi:nucleoside-diphosphate-sugar epimerase
MNLKSSNMRTCLIIGGRGFVGSAIASAVSEAGWAVSIADRQTYNSYLGQEFDLIINANGNAKKYLANQNPHADFEASLRSVALSLNDFQCQKYIYISTIDVYEDTTSELTTLESAQINPMNLDTYGFHKRLAELVVMRKAKSWHIFRLGQMVGPGLVKGPIFDLITGQPIRITLDSEFPFLNTKSMANAIMQLNERAPDNQIFNVCGVESVAFRQLTEHFPYLQATISHAARRQVYRINTDKALAFCDLPHSQDEIASFLLQKA